MVYLEIHCSDIVQKSLISDTLCSKRYPAANGPPVDRRCEQCGSIFKVSLFSQNICIYTPCGIRSTHIHMYICRIHVVVSNLCFSQLGGPIWSAPMHDTEFVQGLLEEVQFRAQDYNTAARIKGLLTVISEVNCTPNSVEPL